MIDIKQLRVGAHISIGGKRQCVSNIDALNGQIGIGAYKTGSDGVKHAIAYAIEDAEPIPITAELLQELGLAKYCGEAVSFIDAKSAKMMAERNGKNMMPIIEIWQGEYTRPYWIAVALCSNGDIPLPHARAAVRYLHELESFVYMTTKQELMKED